MLPKSFPSTCMSTYDYVLTGLNVAEVAHDFQQQIKNYVANDLQLVNSYDTWHGICSACVMNE